MRCKELDEVLDLICDIIERRKKFKIQYLINESKPEFALEELSDWDKILPEDVDFALFRSLLNK